MSRADRIVEDADQVEWSAYRLGAAVPVISGLRDDLLSESISEDSELGGVQQPDAEMEDRVSDIVQELDRRSSVLGVRYPFRINHQAQSVSYASTQAVVYEFCLAISVAPSLTKGRYVALPREFERLAGAIMASFLGEGANWYRLGWPPEADRPKVLKQAVQELSRYTGEWVWQRNPHYTDEWEGHQSVKDGGVDLVVWKYPPDARVGGLTLVGQCACGNDWSVKASDLSHDRIAAWCARPTVAKESRFFAMPRHIADPNVWVTHSLAAGLVLDRARLVLLNRDESQQTNAKLVSLIEIVAAISEPISR
jgi:hypothetical protein